MSNDIRNEALLKEDEVAKHLGISIETLRKWRAQKKGPPYLKLESDAVRYQPSDLAAWKQNNRKVW